MISLVVGVSTLVAETVFWSTVWSATPAMTIQDAYKWIYHAAKGGEHAISNRDAVTQWMEREWAGLRLEAVQAESLVTRLDPWSRVIRVNLRPAKRDGLESAAILDWFVNSAGSYRSDALSFQIRWQSLGCCLSELPGSFAFTRTDWIEFDRMVGSRGYPAVHHSEAYVQAYRPAYRVGLFELWAP